MDEKEVNIVITVYPPKSGKRQIIVSAAPSGEMPIVHAGVFADIHNLLNLTWSELIRRKPQVPKGNLTAPAKAETKPADTAPAGDDLPAETPAQPAQLAELPVIEGDQLVAPATTAPAESSAALLSSLDESEASDGE